MTMGCRNFLRRAVFVVLLPFMTTADPVLADPAEDKWKDEIFTWLEKNAISGETHTPKVTQIQANADLLGHRYDCLESAAFQIDPDESGISDWDIGDDLYHGSQIGGRVVPLQWIDERYWGGVGCRPRSCDEKALILADARDRLIHYGLIHYYPWYEITNSNLKFSRRAYFSIFIDPATPINDFDRVARLSEELAEAALMGQRRLRGPGTLYAVSCGE